MESKPLRDYLGSQRRLALILWGTFAWSIALLTGVAFHLASVRQKSGAENQDALGFVQLSIGFGAMAAVLVVAGVFLRRLLLSDRRLEAAAAAPSSNRQVQSLPADDQPLARMVAPWLVAHIISWALNEAILILGFCLTIITGDFVRLYPFLALALLSHLMTIPRFHALEEKLRHLAGRQQ